jgi:hypothetical protein
MEHTPKNEPIEGVVSIEGYTQSAGTGFKESLLLSVNPEAEFVDPDEDLDSVFARRGGAFEEVQTWRPVIVRIHPDAGRETVLRLLEKMRAKVERDWEAIYIFAYHLKGEAKHIGSRPLNTPRQRPIAPSRSPRTAEEGMPISSGIMRPQRVL